MAKGYGHYKEIQKMLKEAQTVSDYFNVYQTIKTKKGMPFSHKDVINTLEHIWGYFKSEATFSEKHSFFTMLEEARTYSSSEYDIYPRDVKKAIGFLAYLLELYPNRYMEQSSIFRPWSEWNMIRLNKQTINVSEKDYIHPRSL